VGNSYLKRKIFQRGFLVLCHVVVFLIVSKSFVQAQTLIETDILNDGLTEMGFENVRSAVNDSVIVAAFENRRYRDDGRAIAGIIEWIDETFSPNESLEINLIVLHQKTPMVLVQFNLKDYRELTTGEIAIETFREKMLVTSDCTSAFAVLQSEKMKNRSQLKPDIVVIPQVRTQFGDFDNPVQSNINLIPELQFHLTKGLSFRGQYIIPLQNDFYFDDEGKTVRPGNITLNQFLRLEDNVYIDIAAGFFNKNRAGANLEIQKIFADGKFSIGANLGYTTGYSYTGYQTDYLDYQNYLTALLELEYRYVPYDLTGLLQVGNFLYNSPGVRFDILRQFGEVKIGFFMLATQDVFNGGFMFSLPLPPRKYTKLKYGRIRPSKNFSWEYRARGFPTSGTMYNTGNSLINLFLEFNPNQIKNQIIRQFKKKY
jgi:hypothetical protein